MRRSAIGKITKRSPDPIKREFLRLADKVTDQELQEQDAALDEHGLVWSC